MQVAIRGAGESASRRSRDLCDRMKSTSFAPLSLASVCADCLSGWARGHRAGTCSCWHRSGCFAVPGLIIDEVAQDVVREWTGSEHARPRPGGSGSGSSAKANATKFMSLFSARPKVLG